MRNWTTACVSVFAVMMCSISPCMTAQTGVGTMVVGVDRSNIAWLPTAKQHEVIDQMKAAGVTTVRLTLTPPMDKSLDAVVYAAHNGLQVLLDIGLGNEVFYAPGTPVPAGIGGKPRARPLSKLDVPRMQAALTAIFAQLDHAKVSLLAVEVGNEFNWAPFNGDFDIHPEHKELATNDLTKMPNRVAIEAGFARYIEAVHVVRTLMQASQRNQSAALISGGLAGVPAAFAARMGMDTLPSADVLRELQSKGLNTVVDGYGVHDYPNPSITSQARMAVLTNIMAACETGSGGKPCWLTEWGVANKTTACPADESKRLPLVTELRSDFAELHHQGRLQAIFYFDWDTGGENAYQLWRCGELDAAGRAALALVDLPSK